MNKITKIVSSAVVLLSLATPVFAAAPFAAKTELRKEACVNAVGSPVINVVQKVKNDVDSGQGGNYWAYDNYTRHITVYKTTTENVYCGIVKYDGKFTTVAGRSPGNTADIPAGIRGEMKGGRRTTEFTATMKAVPLQKKFGSVGTFDYQGDLQGNLPGWQSWTGWYFDNMSGFGDAWWGWKYEAEDGGKGTWVNAVYGNTGDILAAPAHSEQDHDEESD